MARKAKTLTPAQVAEKCAELLQRIVRLKAARAARSPFIRCVTCGKVDHWKEMQGGHYIQRGKTATKLVEENINPQCSGCNGPRRGNPHEYAKFMYDTYGPDFVSELVVMSRQINKWNRIQLEAFRDDLKREAAELEAEVSRL